MTIIAFPDVLYWPFRIRRLNRGSFLFEGLRSPGMFSILQARSAPRDLGRLYLSFQTRARLAGARPGSPPVEVVGPGWAWAHLTER